MKDSNNSYALDANVILRHVLQDNAALSSRATAIFIALEEERLTVVLDPVNLAEVVWVLRSSYGHEPEVISETLRALLANVCLIMPHKTRYIEALRLYGIGVRSFGDACACAEAVETCDGKLLSFDKALGRVPGISRHEDV